MTDKLREQSIEFAKKHLFECAKEILDWGRTSTLCDGKLRELAKTCEAWVRNESYALGVAEAIVKEEALRAALAQQDAQAVERVGDPVTITRLATLVDEETQRILADSLDLIKQINYMVGIAERGTGKKCPDGERPEVFLLDYVKSLEAALSQQDAQAAGESLRDLAAKYIAEDEAAESSINRLMTLGRKMADAINAAPTPPAQRVMLTDEEIEDLARGKSGHSDFARDIIEAYERKNGIK